MKIAVLAVGIAASLLISPSVAAAASPYAASCKVDDEISAVERDTATAAALGLVQNLLEGNASAVFEGMSPKAQSATGLSALSAIAQFVKLNAPYQNVRVVHTYSIEAKSVGGAALPPIRCGKTRDDPDAVMLSVAPAPSQIDVEVSAHTINNDWSAFVILIREQGAWKALSFHFDPSAMSGRSARDLGRLAREQAGRGHRLNAALLYKAADGIAGRGPNATPVWKGDLDKDVASFVPPEELAGLPPFKWHADGQILSVGSVGIIGIAGKLSLIIEQRPKEWPGDAVADRESRAFITSIVKAYPEFSEVFAAVIVRSFKPDGTGGFGTAYEFGKGFDGPR